MQEHNTMNFSSEIEWDGAKIENRSHALIDAYLDSMSKRFSDAQTRAIVRRIIHSTADFSFADTVFISPDSIARGIEAINKGANIICDVRMAAAGCTHGNLNVTCEISNPEVIKIAAAKRITRSAAAIEYLGKSLNGSILVIGNAPTALWKIMELWDSSDDFRPALVIGLPVGFVGAYESKLALSKSSIPCITNISPRGGSPVAAAAFNALYDLSKKAQK
jgi:precorrin-8X/cobalt-precorrin-8 methylmutase